MPGFVGRPKPKQPGLASGSLERRSRPLILVAIVAISDVIDGQLGPLSETHSQS